MNALPDRERRATVRTGAWTVAALVLITCLSHAALRSRAGWLTLPLPLPEGAHAVETHSRILGWRAVSFSDARREVDLASWYDGQLAPRGWTREPGDPPHWRCRNLSLTLKVDAEQRAVLLVTHGPR